MTEAGFLQYIYALPSGLLKELKQDTTITANYLAVTFKSVYDDVMKGRKPPYLEDRLDIHKIYHDILSRITGKKRK